jgi:hypothetical protein
MVQSKTCATASHRICRFMVSSSRYNRAIR